MSTPVPTLTRETCTWHVIESVEGGDLEGSDHDIDAIVDAVHAETGGWDPAVLAPARWSELVAEHTLT